jgi:hypothetical protein
VAPAIDNIEHYQGDTFTRAYACYTDQAQTVARNLSGYTAKAQLRETASPTATLIASFTAAISGASSNIITISLTAAQTSAIAQTTGWFDVQVTSAGGVVETLVRGKITFTAEVTTNA